MMFRYFLVLFLAVCVSVVGVVATSFAQRAPGESEIAEYDGLHKAAHENDLERLRDLIAQGADLEARDGNGRRPVHVAAFASNDAIVTELGKAGANMNALDGDRYDAVTIAAVANDPDLVSAAIEAGNDPGLTTSIYDGTALIAAAHLGHHEVVRRLIEAGAPLDHINNLGWTALIEAVILGDGGANHQKTAVALVEAGADISIADRDGITPLDHARSRGFDEMVAIIESREQ